MGNWARGEKPEAIVLLNAMLFETTIFHLAGLLAAGGLRNRFSRSTAHTAAARDSRFESFEPTARRLPVLSSMSFPEWVYPEV